MLIATQIRILETPVWKEIKNWSLDDKRNLITLLYDAMEEENQDCNIEDATEEYAKSFPKDILEMASEYAIKESRAGRGIPHKQAMQMIKEQMGWK